MLKALETKVTTRTSFKGHLDSYRFCDQVGGVAGLVRSALDAKEGMQLHIMAGTAGG